MLMYQKSKAMVRSKGKHAVYLPFLGRGFTIIWDDQNRLNAKTPISHPYCRFRRFSPRSSAEGLCRHPRWGALRTSSPFDGWCGSTIGRRQQKEAACVVRWLGCWQVSKISQNCCWWTKWCASHWSLVDTGNVTLAMIYAFQLVGFWWILVINHISFLIM